MYDEYKTYYVPLNLADPARKIHGLAGKLRKSGFRVTYPKLLRGLSDGTCPICNDPRKPGYLLCRACEGNSYDDFLVEGNKTNL